MDPGHNRMSDYLPAFAGAQVPQQHGVLFMSTQQVQPHLVMQSRQSQQA